MGDSNILRNKGISDIEEIGSFLKLSHIEGTIFKGIVDGQEYLYYYEGLPGSWKWKVETQMEHIRKLF